MGIIKNAAIDNAVCERLQKTAITEEDILAVTELDLQRMNLTEIDDLARFSNLESLNIIENCLTNLSPLSELINLRVLKAGNDPFLSD